MTSQAHRTTTMAQSWLCMTRHDTAIGRNQAVASFRVLFHATSGHGQPYTTPKTPALSQPSAILGLLERGTIKDVCARSPHTGL